MPGIVTGLEQRPGLAQIRRRQAFGEPDEDGRQEQAWAWECRCACRLAFKTGVCTHLTVAETSARRQLPGVAPVLPHN
jgi:hypothetical protein